MIYFIWFVLVISIMNLALLSFAFRDMSFFLVLQFLFSAVLIPVATYLITRHYYPLPNLVLVTEDEKSGKLSHWWSYSNKEDEPDPQANGFFDSCH